MNTTKQKQRRTSPQDYAKAYFSARLEDLTLRAASIDLSRKRAGSWQLSKAADRAAERMNAEVLLRQAATTRHELDQTRHALSRIAIGSYGLCERCGTMIYSFRLRAVPEATVCTSCAQDSGLAVSLAA